MLQPLLLTLLGAAGTGIGGMMVVLQPQLSWRRLGALQVSRNAVHDHAMPARGPTAVVN